MKESKVIDHTTKMYSSLQNLFKFSIKKFKMFAEQIIKGMIDSKNSLDIFSTEEKGMLGSMLSIDIDQIELMMLTQAKIWMECSKLRTAKKIKNYLSYLEIPENNAEVILQIWKELGNTLMSKLKEKDVCISSRLNSFQWNISMPSQFSEVNFKEGKIDSFQLDPLISFSFNTRNDEFNLEMNKQELHHLIDKLENLQSSIDSLCK